MDRRGLGDRAVFDGAEEGKQFVHLYLFDLDPTQEVAGKGLQVLGRLDQPAQDRVWVTFKDPGHGTDAEAFGQRRNGPYQPVGLTLLGVKRCASRFQEIPVAAQTQELAPAPAIGMAVGAEVPEANPTVIHTGSMGAEVVRGINLAVTPSSQHHTGWRCAEGLRISSGSLLAGLAIGFAGKTRKQFGLTRSSGRFVRR